ncbi:MAG: exonuclease, partial [Candidatus Lokiarchaeota archaeon]|nr:exonuclease [Candidatus Lokiarchaeota archaeon]
RPKGISSTIWKRLVSELPAIKKAIIDNNIKKIRNFIPKKLHWHLIPNYLGKIAYLDIETTGLSPDNGYITTIAIYDGKKLHNYIRGKNLNEFPKFIEKFPAIATYYGKGFDVPFIKKELGIELPKIHFDLCFLLRRLGYTGGLKSVEKQLGIPRGDCSGLNGYAAIVLWNYYNNTNDRRYLETLLAYNNQDVLNLEPLLYKSYNGLLEKNEYAFNKISFMKKTINQPFEPHLEIIEEILPLL